MKNKKRLTVTVGIPAYNEAENIAYLLRSILKQKRKTYKLEKIIVVCDGRTDNTASIVKDFSRRYKNIRLINHSQRRGKAEALNEIYTLSQSDFLLTIDADIVFARDIEIELMLEIARKDQKINLISPLHVPVRPTTIMGKFSYVSYLSFQDAFLKLNSGNNCYSSMGVSLIRKELYKSFKYPKGTISDQLYLYAMATRKNKDRYQLARKARVLFHPVGTFQDWRLLGVRAVSLDKENVAKFFGKEILNEFSMPKKLFFLSLLKWLLKSPFYTLGSIMMNIYIRKFPYKKALPKNGMWEPTISAKQGINVQPRNIKICLFGTYDRNYTSNQMILKALQANNAEIVEVNAHTPLTKLDSTEDMTWWQILKRVLRKKRIFREIIKNAKEIQQTNAIYVGYPGHVDVILACLVAKIFRKKLVFNPLVIISTGFIEEQGILKRNSLLGTIIRFGEKFIYHLCDLVLADTPFQREFLRKYFKIPNSKLRVLSIGADDEYYRYTPYTNTKGVVNVVYYGLYSPIHGVEHIIECADLCRKDKDIKFTFVGQGHTFEENFKKAKELKLPNVKFFHHIPIEQHPPLLQKADLFLGFLQDHPSVKRIIPNKVYQGLALGKVVVTADSPVARSVFTDKVNIYLVKPSDPEDLAKAITELKNNPRLRKQIAENGYKLFKEKFAPKTIGRQLISYLEEIL